MGVLGLERAAIDLSGAETRQGFLRENEALGDFELRQLAVEEGAQIVFVEPFAIFQMNDRDWHFAQALIRRPEYRDFGDRWAGVAFGLHLRRRDILAAADDDLFLAVDDEQIAVVIEIADVAG